LNSCNIFTNTITTVNGSDYERKDFQFLGSFHRRRLFLFRFLAAQKMKKPNKKRKIGFHHELI